MMLQLGHQQERSPASTCPPAQHDTTASLHANAGRLARISESRANRQVPTIQLPVLCTL